MTVYVKSVGLKNSYENLKRVKMAKEEEKDPEDTSKSSKRKKKRKLSWLREDPAGKAVHVSAAGAQAAGTAGGEGLATIGRAAPALQVAAVAYDAYQIGRNVEKDRRRGTSRNTVKKVTTTVSAYGGGIGGAVAGGKWFEIRF